MKVFVAASYSTKVDEQTGQVLADHQKWLENILDTVEKAGHSVFCALREDKYNINNADVAGALQLDIEQLKQSEVLLALLDDHSSAGVQTEIGMAHALGKKVILAHLPEHKLRYFNDAMIKAGLARELALPLTPEKLAQVLSS